MLKVNLHCIPQEFVGCGEWVEPWDTLQQEEEDNPGTGEEDNPEREEEDNPGTGEEDNPEREEGGSLELEQKGDSPEREEGGTPARVQ